MTDNVVQLRPIVTYAKISRNGERFWVECLGKGMGNTLYGKVANNLIENHPYKYGDVIEYASTEVVESAP